MRYEDTTTGRVAGQGSTNGRFWTFEDVRERMVGAMECWWRMPDRERSWQHVRSAWPPIMRRVGGGALDPLASSRFGARVVVGEVDHEEEDPQPARPSLTRREIEEAREASEWMQHVPERDRRLVSMVLASLAAGAKRVPWLSIWNELGRGRPGPDGLEKRFTRALAGIAEALNR